MIMNEKRLFMHRCTNKSDNTCSNASCFGAKGMGTRMSEEDRMRLEKFEQMQSKGGFGAGGGVTGGEGSSLPVVDVTPGPPSESVVESETTEIATAGGMEEPKGPIGKALKFVNENASKLEGQIEVEMNAHVL